MRIIPALATVWLIIGNTVLLDAQTRPMTLAQSRYELKAGDSVQLSAPDDTTQFLLAAASRNAAPVNGGSAGFTVGPDRAGTGMRLAASLRTSPGEYAVTLTAKNAAGEEQQTTVDVVVSPKVTVPVNATRAPVVLLNGWETGFVNACPVSNSSSDTFGNLEQYLKADGVPAVYFFDNCAEDPNQPIEVLAADLAKFLATVQYDDGTQVQQIDLVAHSMGGLIARAYLAGLQPDQSLNPPVNTLVHKLILIATPNFGSVVAGNFENIIPSGTQSAELIPGSSFLWNLATWNQHIDDLRGVDAVAIAGNAGTYVNSFTSSSLVNAGDGVVSLTSASLGFVAQDASVTRIVPYCHVDPGAFTNASLEPYNCNAPGIANITSEDHPTSRIVRSFLAGTSDWKSIGTTPASDLYLGTNGGTLFALLNGTGSYVTDVSQVAWGTLQLQTGGAAGTIFYDDFVIGTGDFQVSSQSLGQVDCGTITQAAGYFSAARCKVAATIISVGPLASTPGKVVTSGSTLTITGATLGALCNGCKVIATPAGSTSGQTLSVSAWSNTSITAQLPANLSGLVTLSVQGSIGNDTINIMVASPQAPAITVAPTSLQFTSVNGAAPDPQSIQVTNTGGGTLAWTATASDAWLKISAASGTAPSTVSVSIDASALSAGTYNGSIQISASGATNSPASVSVTLVVQGTQTGGATITAVSNAGSFQAGFASAAWISIFGTNLASTTYSWQAADFVNGQLPVSLQGVSVTIDGKPAYVEYISPGQINVLAPDDAATGSVQIQSTSNQQQSNSFSAQKQSLAPAFFTTDGTSIAAVHADYTLIDAAHPAKPGEVIVLYGTGFGSTNPAVATDQLVTTAEPLANPAQISIGGANAPVAFAGLVEAGLYQFNVTVPAGVSGSVPVIASILGAQSQNGASIAVQQ
ncbi:MAG TPA: hypothetical protein VHZ74_07265 [Bryobacteraceae bacterium]|nr:hypothetical protein [Bryobacteraceae bacterium]